MQDQSFASREEAGVEDSGTGFWGSSYEQDFFYNGTRHQRMRVGGNNPHYQNPYNKYKLRPTEPTMNNYGKTKELDAYL